MAEGEFAPPPKPILLLPSKAELITERERIVLASQNFEGNELQAIRAENWKYIEANEDNPRGLEQYELYDLRVDDGEKDNLAGKSGQRQKDMAEMMRAQFKAAQELRVEEKQADLLRNLALVVRHYAAACLSLRATRSFDAARILVAACAATVADATKLGYPHFSSLPDSWYKLFLWNLTEYSKVFYFYPDTLTQRDAAEAYLRYEAFAAEIHPRSGAMHNLQGGMMVLQPSRRDFEVLQQLWHAGDYPYADARRRGDVSYGDDDQHFLNYAVLRRRVGLGEFQHVDGHLDGLGDVLGVAVVEAHGVLLSRRRRLLLRLVYAARQQKVLEASEASLRD